MDSASKEDKLDVSCKLYVQKWVKSAANLDQQKCYDWMSSRVAEHNPKRILDIGCGDGTGLMNLIKGLNSNDFFIISSEDNPECINRAIANIASSSQYPAKSIMRYANRFMDDEVYAKEIITSSIAVDAQINIIESNILFDEVFVKFLESQPKFDLVTVWLIGTHTMQSRCSNFSNLEIGTAAEYRLRVQNKVYELADMVLDRNGIFQVVDRGEVPNTEELREDFINAHRDQASVTSLTFNAFDYLEYQENEDKGKMGMKYSIGTSGRMPDKVAFALMSVLFQKVQTEN